MMVERLYGLRGWKHTYFSAVFGTVSAKSSNMTLRILMKALVSE